MVPVFASGQGEHSIDDCSNCVLLALCSFSLGAASPHVVFGFFFCLLRDLLPISVPEYFEMYGLSLLLVAVPVSGHAITFCGRKKKVGTIDIGRFPYQCRKRNC